MFSLERAFWNALYNIYSLNLLFLLYNIYVVTKEAYKLFPGNDDEESNAVEELKNGKTYDLCNMLVVL